MYNLLAAAAGQPQPIMIILHSGYMPTHVLMATSPLAQVQTKDKPKAVFALFRLAVEQHLQQARISLAVDLTPEAITYILLSMLYGLAVSGSHPERPFSLITAQTALLTFLHGLTCSNPVK